MEEKHSIALMRTLIVVQIACTALIGAIARSNFLRWAEPALSLGFFPVLIGPPVVVYFAWRCSVIPRWKRLMIFGIEILLVCTAFIAMLPAVQ